MASGNGTNVKSLSEIEVVHCLEKLCNFSVTIDSLRNPTPQFMESVFECIMKDIMLNVDAVRQEPFKANLMIEHKESYEHVLPFITFFSLARQIMQTAGVTDFSVKDLTEPKRKRAKKILGHLIILWKHVLVKMQRYRSVESKCQGDIQHKAKLMEELKNMQDRYEGVLASRINPAEREQLLKKKAEKEEKLKHLVKQKDALNRKYQNIKADLANEQKEISELEIKIVSEKEKLEELDNKILQSPNRFMSEIEELKQKLAELDKKVLDMKRSIKEERQEREALLSKHNSIEEVMSRMAEVAERLDLFRDEITAAVDLHKTHERKAGELKVKQASLDKLRDQLHLCEQKMTKVQLQHKMQVEHMKKLSTMAKESLKKEMAAHKCIQEQESQLRKIEEKILAEIAAQEKEKETVVSQVMEEIAPMQKEFEDYIKTRTEDADETLENLKEIRLIYDSKSQ